MTRLYSLLILFLIGHCAAQTKFVVLHGVHSDSMAGLRNYPCFYIGQVDSVKVFHPTDSLQLWESIWGHIHDARIDDKNLYWLFCQGGHRTSRIVIRFGTIPHQDGRLLHDQGTVLEASRRRPRYCFVGAEFGEKYGPAIESCWAMNHITDLKLPAFPMEKRTFKKLFRLLMRTARGYPKAVRRYSNSILLESI